MEEAYNKYKDLKNDGYTENSWKTFKNALDAAKAVLEYEDATAEQVDAALAQLEKAVSGLKKAPMMEVETIKVDKITIRNHLQVVQAQTEV